MYTKTKILLLFLFAVVLNSPTPAAVKKKPAVLVETTDKATAVLWREPVDIQSRNLFYGPGGKQHEPQGTFTFVKEDLEESNPKFVVEDQDGVKWKVKLGSEARPETIASRLVWAVGYFANEDYFLSVLRPENMPARLQREQKFVDHGSVRNVRLKRELPGEKKIGNWAWREDPFTDTRELNGLRVMMALINNWDLKDENNAVYEESGAPERISMISDLGSSFGTSHPWWPRRVARGNLHSYVHSKFIRKVSPDTVDFRVPGSPPKIYFLINRTEYRARRDMTWIGRTVPRAHVHWIGQILAKLCPNQIRDAFRAAGYTPEQVEQFATVIEHRIAELREV